ncbi:ferric reductase [Stemphylium lycopersici]|uniref:Ferric reductase n=1 Tax=Stemphylium lycopersici TaxID=183478 RepID=A0A364N4W3_STELY|nr:ferric reductase [Stemphylium lycopersici]
MANSPHERAANRSNIEDSSDYDPFKYSHGLAGVNQPLNYLFVNILVATALVPTTLALCFRIFVSVRNDRRRLSAVASCRGQDFWKSNRHSNWGSFKRHFLYAPVKSSSSIETLSFIPSVSRPLRPHLAVILVYFFSNLAYCFAIPRQPCVQMVAEFRGRSGALAAFNLILTVLFALRNNLLIQLLHVSYDTFNLFHRWAARIVVLESAAHVSAFLYNTYQVTHEDKSGWRAVSWILAQSVSFKCGLTSFVAFLLLMLHSIGPFRRSFYETFLTLHRVGVAIAISGIYFHLARHALPQLPWIYLVIFLLVLEHAARLYRIVRHNLSWKQKTWSHVRLEALPGEATRVTFSLPHSWNANPGSHIQIYLPRIALLGSHPFSVAWSQSSGYANSLSEKLPTTIDDLETERGPSTVTCIIRSRQGMTRSLHQLASKADNVQLRIWGAIEGPYGGNHYFDSYGTVVLFAGGVGITHQLSFVRHLLVAHNQNTAATQKIVLVWCMADLDALGTLDTPLEYPAALLKRRVQRPGYLYAVVDKAHITTDPGKALINSLDAFTKSNIEAHLAQNRDSAVVNGLITAYEDEEVALNRAKRGKVAKLTLSTDDLVAAWQITNKGTQVPIWFVSGDSKNAGAREQRNLWICLEEARVALNIDERLGEKGTWLACGPGIKRIITRSLKRQEGQSLRDDQVDALERVFDDEEKEEADRQARQERRRLVRDTEHIKDTEKLGRKDSSRSLQPPKIPTRKSSLKSLALKAKTQPSDARAPKLRVTTRDATISLTNADQHRATSLMKYTLLMAHGKRLEAEETWLLETTPSGRSIGRRESMRTIGDGSRTEDDTESRCNQGSEAGAENLLTPQETWRASSRQPSVDDHGHESERQSRREGFQQPSWQYDVPSDNDSHSGQEQRVRNRRSAAPSPSQSLLGYRSPEVDLETEPEPTLQVRRSRRDLLIELQSDEDALLREYARVSLLDSAAFKDQRDNRKEDVSHETDHEAYRRDIDQAGYQSARSASGAPTPLFRPPPSTEPEHRTDEESQPPVPSLLYSSLSLSSLSTFASHTPAENTTHATSFVGQQRVVHIPENRSLKPAPANPDDEEEKLQPRSEPDTLRSKKIVEREQYRAAISKPYVGQDQQQQQQQQQQSKDNVSRSESLFAKSKGLREKGKEISGRLAELRERQKPAVVKKKNGKWDAGDALGHLGSNSER